MAITRDQVKAAVEQYLPRTINYAESADLGEKDRASIFDRMMQIILTSLLLDRDSVFYLVFLSSQRLLTSINTAIDELETLQSTDLLKTINEDPPIPVDDLSELQESRVDLLQLSGSIAQGSFGTVHFTSFKGNINSFLTEQITPNVQGRNRIAVSAEIRALMQSLATNWETVRTRRGRVFLILDEFLEEDLRAKVASVVIDSISDRISEIESSLASQTTAEQAAGAESVLVDLAAAQAALQVLGDAPAVLGTPIILPVDTGYTDATYLEFTGTGRIEPLAFVTSGDSGRLYIDSVLVGEEGNAIDDSDGDSLTPDFEDTSVDFVAAGVQEDYFLTLVKTGFSYRITSVGVNTLQVTPEIPITVSADRWVVTERVPGSYFRDDSQSFWTEYPATGETPSTRIVNGSGFSFRQVIKASGSDGTNVRTSGGAGVAQPWKVSGPSGWTQTAGSPEFSDSVIDPEFLSNLVDTANDVLHITSGNAANEAGSPYIISSVDGQNALEISGTFPTTGIFGQNWHIRADFAEELFESSSANFLSNGVEAGDTLTIDGGSYDGTYTVDSVVSQTQLQLDTAPFTTQETGVAWYVRYDDNIFVAPGATFLSDGVQAGDTIHITEGIIDDAFIIVSVDSQTQLTLSSAVSDVLTGADWEVFETDQATDRFQKILPASPPTLEDSGISRLTEDGVLNILTAGGIDYTIAQRLSPDILEIDPLAEAYDGATDSVDDTIFTSEDASFTTDIPNTAGVPDDTFFVRIEGVGYFQVDSVVSDTEISIGAGAGTGLSNLAYRVLPAITLGTTWSIRAGDYTSTFLDTSLAPFNSLDVNGNRVFDENDILVLYPGTPDEQRFTIKEIVSDEELVVNGELPQGLLGVEYAVINLVKEGMVLVASNRKADVKEVINKTRLRVSPPLPGALGINVDYHVMRRGVSPTTKRLTDPSQGGFPSSVIGTKIDIMLQRPLSGRVVNVADPDGDSLNEALDVDVKMRLGFQKVAYKLLSEVEGTTTSLKTSEDLSAVQEGDDVTVWEVGDAAAVTAVGTGELTVDRSIPTGRSGLNFAVVRGGSPEYGRYLLYKSLAEGVDLDETTSRLRLRVAQVLIDFGGTPTAVESGVSGEVVEDGDENGQSRFFRDVTKDFVAAGATFGDRLTVVLNDGTDDYTEVTFVDAVSSTTTLTVDPELPQDTVVSWELERNSVSFALAAAEELKQQLEALRAVVEAYTVPPNSSLRNVLSVLTDQQMDRARNLLLNGEVTSFVNMQESDSTYTAAAKAAAASAGSSVRASEKLQDNVAGTNPATGSRTTDATASATTAQNTTVPEEVETVVALAEGASELAADELTQAAAQISLEELRNRAIYELTGEVESGVITDTDPTLPWIAVTGSKRRRIEQRAEAMIAAIQYMIDNPDEFDEATTSE